MKRRLGTSAVLVLGLAGALALSPGAPAKKGNSKTFEKQIAPNAGVPQWPVTTPSVPLTSEITVPKKFKKKTVGDVNVTAFQTTGSAVGAANDLTVRLTAPGGQAVQLFRRLGNAGANGVAGFGPWTMDDDSSHIICNNALPQNCVGDPENVPLPFAGTTSLIFTQSAGTGPLAAFNGAKMRGTWTLSLFDDQSPTESSVLNQWGLQIKAAKPVK